MKVTVGASKEFIDAYIAQLYKSFKINQVNEASSKSVDAKPIRFELDVSFEDSKESPDTAIARFKKVVKSLGGTVVSVRDDQGADASLLISVPTKQIGNKIINTIYGPEGAHREPNSFYIGK